MSLPLRGSEIESLRVEPVPTERRACFREIAGETFNNLQDCCQVLDMISRSMVGDADANRSQPEIKCFRDSLIGNMETSRYVLEKLNQIAEVLGV